MIAYNRVIEAAMRDGRAVKESCQGKAMVQCPAHDDGRPSLSVRQIDGQVLMYCHAGCQTTQVVDKLDLTMADLFDDPAGRTYEYPDDRRVHRTPGKQFKQSGARKRTGGALYHSDRIGDATTVYVVEGEKDVDAVESADGVAVCSAMGAGKAHLADWTTLRGLDVIVVADRDDAGRKHATQVAGLLDGIAASVRIVEAKVGKDAADHIAADLSLDEFEPIEAPTDDRPKLRKATELRPGAQPRWLAKNRLQRSAINLLIGDEGIGKSLLWVWIVAAVTTGKPLPEFGIPARTPGHVILVCTEDDWTTIVRPRLEVAGADLAMVLVICVEDDGSGAPVFPRDIYLIAEADPAPTLVVVDAWLDTVPAGLSVRDPQQARLALHPWKELATTTEAAVLLLCHTNRVASASARDRYGATGELRKKARLTLYAQEDDEGRLVVGPEKMNTAAPIPASTFTIRSVQHFAPTDDSDGTVPLLVYAGDSERTAREHIADAYEADHGTDQQDRADAERWLYDYLLENPSAKSADVKRDAKKHAGISERTLQRARTKLGVVVGYIGMPAVSTWILPANTAVDGGLAATGNRDAAGVSRGTTGTTGISPGQQVVPSCATSVGGTTVAQQHDQQQHPVVPVVPETQGRLAQQLPSGLTPHTPGQTPRVQQALVHARANGHTAASPEANDAYRAGLCRDCRGRPHSPGRPRCDECHRIWANVTAGYDR